MRINATKFRKFSKYVEDGKFYSERYSKPKIEILGCDRYSQPKIKILGCDSKHRQRDTYGDFDNFKDLSAQYSKVLI